MPRSRRLMVSLSARLMFSACHPSTARPVGERHGTDQQAVTSTPAAGREEPELTFEQVLQVPRANTLDAQRRMERVRDEARDRQLRMLARRILGRWTMKRTRTTRNSTSVGEHMHRHE
jgi:hypothetical protein